MGVGMHVDKFLQMIRKYCQQFFIKGTIAMMTNCDLWIECLCTCTLWCLIDAPAPPPPTNELFRIFPARTVLFTSPLPIALPGYYILWEILLKNKKSLVNLAKFNWNAGLFAICLFAIILSLKQNRHNLN